MQTGITIPKKRRSVALRTEEKKALQKFVKGYITITEAAEVIGISREVLTITMIKWTASSDTINLIRKAIAA